MPKDFFDSDLVVATYDLLTEQANKQIAGDVAFYLDCALRYGGPVLELGVGTGRIAWALAEAGHEVVGIDRSKSMLDAARRKGEKHAGAVGRLDLVEADIGAFDLDQTFPLAIMPFSTFQHLASADQQRACLSCIRRHLAEDGRLVLDVFDPILDACVPDAPTPNPDREAIDPVSGHVLRRRSISRRNDPLSQTFVETFRLERIDGSGTLLESDDATHHLRWATRQEMAYLFELCGFAIEAQYSDFDSAPPAYGKRQIWIVKAVS
ncbi:MAG: class I SAM-dependent methyltransferase [Pseudomonadota bacterium]